MLYINVMFEGDVERLSLVFLPLVITHPIQLIFGTLSGPYLRRWVAEEERSALLEA